MTFHRFTPIVKFISIAVFFAVLWFIGCGDDDKGTDSQPPAYTGELEQVTSTGGTYPTLSPDGHYLGYKIRGSGIGKMLIGGTTVDTLTTYGTEPDWSKTGNLILFRTGGLLTTVDADSKDTTVIRSGGFDDGQVWSPDGTEIAAEGSSGIAIISYPDGALSTVACTDPGDGGCQGEAPSWSPDGQWIAFEDGLEILKVERSGGTATEVVGGLNDVGSPAWSPNGSWIAFAMQDSGSVDFHIWAADARGKEYGLWRVTYPDTLCQDSMGCYNTTPAWSPDSKIIYFQSNRTGQYEIWRIGFEPE